MAPANIKAVMFDVGGVVLRSPLISINAYEREKGLPPDYLNVLITALGHNGAWQRFERGELDLWSFYGHFGRELSDSEKGNSVYRAYCRKRGLATPALPAVGSLQVDGRELFMRMMRGSREYDPFVLTTIKALRAMRKWRIVALTNNYTEPYVALAASTEPRAAEELAYLGWEEGPAPPTLRDLFEDFVDSSTAGTRKPEPEIYLLACKRNGVKPEEVVFLDDLGLNLKTAARLGMQTIHVPIGGTRVAIEKLEEVLGVKLLSEDQRHSSKL